MINKNFNLHLKLNKLEFNSNQSQSQPFTPIDQTLKTPCDVPNNHQQSFFQPPHQPQNSFYQNLNESDDILTDIDEPNNLNNLSKKNYTVYFTNTFDSLLLQIYNDILSKPTTTPFSGTIPPSGLVGKVANEVILNLIKLLNDINPPLYDQQSIINKDCLKSHEYQPIILQLIRKRLLELCTKDTNITNNNKSIPDSTTIQCANNYMKTNSISSISLNEMNLMNYNSQQQSQQQPPPNNSSSASSIRSRSSSLNLRKQSLTRNNSNNWLHVGNISSLRPQLNNEFNISTDSLQSIQDFVPQTLINRSNQQQQQTIPSQAQLNSMMNDYHITPPTSHKSSISSTNANNNYHQLQQTFSYSEDQDCNNYLQRSRSSSKGTSTLSLNINHANNLNHDQISLDSPFCSSTDEYFPGFQQQTVPPQQQSMTIPQLNETENETNERSSLKNLFTLSEKKRDSLKLKRGIY